MSTGISLVLAVILLGCQAQSGREQSEPSKAPFHFVDASREAGLDFLNVSGSPEQNYVLESMSTGAAFLDYDNDGFQDLFVVNGRGWNTSQRRRATGFSTMSWVPEVRGFSVKWKPI